MLYFAGAQVVNGVNHGVEVWVPIDPLKEKNDVKIKLEYPL